MQTNALSEKSTKNWSDFKIAVPIALGFAALFVLFQKLGLVNLINSEHVTYSTSFIIGVIASLSSCMGMVGGLLLSMSATFVKSGHRIRPQIMFHIGRIASFFVLGGVIGMLGSAFTLNTITTFTLGLIVSIVMFIFGINLLDIFDFTDRIKISMPSFIASRAARVSELNHTYTPILFGIATFFLPCGFTQSMQLYTLTTNNFLTGALTMLSFALGTLPVLAIVSFSSLGAKKSQQGDDGAHGNGVGTESRRSGIFFKTAGLIVIMFALFNLLNSLVFIGLIPPLFNF